MDSKYNPANLMLDRYDYTKWLKEKDEESADIPSMPQLKGDEEEVKEIKILTPNKLLTRHLV